MERIDGPEEVDKDDIIIVCDECDQIWKILWPNVELIESFKDEHEWHTGHRPNDPITAREYFEEADFTEWVVTCSTCDWTQTVETGNEATRLYRNHEQHTGHKANRIQKQ